MDPTIDPTSAPVLRVLFPPLEEDADELVAGEEVCVSDSWVPPIVVVGVLPPSARVLVEGTNAVSIGAVVAVMELNIDDKESFPMFISNCSFVPLQISCEGN